MSEPGAAGTGRVDAAPTAAGDPQHAGGLLGLEIEADRAAARGEAQDLVLRAQTDLAGSAEVGRRLVDRAEAHGWWDVALLAEYAGVIGITMGGDSSQIGVALDRVGQWAERCGDAASLALADAVRARMAVYGPAEAVKSAVDVRLATAVVLLEGRQGRPIERIWAHIECGLGFGARRLWELEVDQYELARRIEPSPEDGPLDPRWMDSSVPRWAIINNLAEVEGHQMCTFYLTGEHEALAARAVQARAVVGGALQSGLPEEWLPDLEAVAVLVEALAGLEVHARAAAVADRLEPGTPFAGTALVAGALSCRYRDPDAAVRLADGAIEALADSDLATEHDLALYLSVELEADRIGHETQGLRLARYHHRERARQRLTNVHSMQALTGAERFRAERESLERDARLDELTRIANRRGYHRYVGAIDRAGTAPLALLAIDVDRFKDINDRFGHDAGDRALQRVAGVISGQARVGDLAARMGGDEFILILGGADLGAARRRADQILGALGRRGRDAPGAAYEHEIAVSIGIAAGTSHQVETLVRRADAALYQAKSVGGRQAIVGYGAAPCVGPVAACVPPLETI